MKYYKIKDGLLTEIDKAEFDLINKRELFSGNKTVVITQENISLLIFGEFKAGVL